MRTTRFTYHKNARYTFFLHFVSKNFGMTVSLKDCVLLLNLFYKNNDYARIALQKFLTLKGMKKDFDLMTVQGLLKMIQKFEKTGSFNVQSGRRRKKMIPRYLKKWPQKCRRRSGGVKPCSLRVQGI